MSVLLIFLPPRPRGPARPGDGGPAPAAEWTWALSPDGQTAGAHGRGTPASWPRADSVAAVLADGDVAWHRVTLPKAPAARMRQALQGVLEERLLDDDGTLHFALPPEPHPGKDTWVAVVHKPWLQAQLAAIETGGRLVDRVLAPAAPADGDGASGHFAPAPGPDPEALQLAWADGHGAALWRLNGTLARARVAAAGAGEQPVHWTATPPAAAAAEAWLGQPVAVLGAPERALQAARGGWNLRQFDLAPRHRGATALRETWRRFAGPDWRPVRWGLAALVAVQLLGLNAWAWQETRALRAKQQAMLSLLQNTHPQVRAVRNAPLQMARETELLRAAAGQPGDTDLETLLAATAAVWPEDEGPVASLRFEPGQLTLGVPDWDDERVALLREQLQPAGWVVGHADGQLTVSRAPQERP